MRGIRASVFTVCFLLLLNNNLLAVDPSILWGTWETTKGDIRILVTVKDNKSATLRINNKIIKNTKYSYCYGEPSIYPFLSLFGEVEGTEHYVYLVVGGKGKHDLEFNILRGFYERSKVDEKREAIKDITSYPIELTRVPEKPRGK